ncbi:protein of unknown function [Georgfuchsia toluolica]|uniref:Uncharacterized protein n=1 Tax=Georgfuchsia toluolica TaxID=424218 RepID=A0A916J567_9PROT|nr:protein of unknown function [Georgfuchsia toluolica]
MITSRLFCTGTSQGVAEQNPALTRDFEQPLFMTLPHLPENWQKYGEKTARDFNRRNLKLFLNPR